MRIDELVIHSDDMGEVVGRFYEEPIREVNLLVVDEREELEAQSAARASLGVATPILEVLPGEVIKGDLVRRSTAAEVIGDKFYAKAIPAGQQVPIDVARSSSQAGLLITWRPTNEDFAVIHEEVPDSPSNCKWATAKEQANNRRARSR
jgi:hypothetical protein